MTRSPRYVQCATATVMFLLLFVIPCSNGAADLELSCPATTAAEVGGGCSVTCGCSDVSSNSGAVTKGSKCTVNIKCPGTMTGTTDKQSSVDCICTKGTVSTDVKHSIGCSCTKKDATESGQVSPVDCTNDDKDSKCTLTVKHSAAAADGAKDKQCSITCPKADSENKCTLTTTCADAAATTVPQPGGTEDVPGRDSAGNPSGSKPEGTDPKPPSGEEPQPPADGSPSPGGGEGTGQSSGGGGTSSGGSSSHGGESGGGSRNESSGGSSPSSPSPPSSASLYGGADTMSAPVILLALAVTAYTAVH